MHKQAPREVQMRDADPLHGVMAMRGEHASMRDASSMMVDSLPHHHMHQHMAANSAGASGMATLHFSTDCGALLVEWWHPRGASQYFVSLVVIFGLAVCAEWLSGKARHRTTSASVRYAADDALQASSQPLCLDGEAPTRPRSVAVRSPQGSLSRMGQEVGFHAASIALQYALMLLAMTFNVGILLAIVLGLAIGRFSALTAQDALGGGKARTAVELCH